MALIQEVHRARDVDDLLARMASSDTHPRIIAGGSDLLLGYGASSEEPLTLIDVTHVEALRTIAEEADGIRIGAAVTLTELIRSEVVRRQFGVLVDGARAIGGPQIRNLATLGGNVCNASPSADTVPALLVLGALAEVRSKKVQRTVPLDEFFVGPGQSVLGPDEVLVSLQIPTAERGTGASYTKVSPREAMDLAVVGVAVAISKHARGITAFIALGAVAPTPVRAKAAENYVNSVGHVDDRVAAEAGRLAEESVSPIDDVRGSARYRRAIVRRIVARDLLRQYEQLESEVVS